MPTLVLGSFDFRFSRVRCVSIVRHNFLTIIIMEKKSIFITRKDRRHEVELVKYCILSNGYKIYLFRNLTLRKVNGNFIVAVKAPYAREAAHFVRFWELSNACTCYLDYVCTYA